MARLEIPVEEPLTHFEIPGVEPLTHVEPLGCVEKGKKSHQSWYRHLNFMEGTCVEHKDHFAVNFESLYLGHNTCKPVTKEMI